MDKKNKRIGKNIKIKKFDDIFDNEVDNINSNNNTLSNDNEKIVFVGGEAIYFDPNVSNEFKGHPFKITGNCIDKLMDSISEHGILSPLIVRPAKNSGTFEIISGHRIKYCAVCLDSWLFLLLFVI